VLPVRDTTYMRDSKLFDELGILDTLGYVDFANSANLVDGVAKRIGDVPPFHRQADLNNEQPLYLIRSHIESEGMVKLTSVLKKSGLFSELLTHVKHLGFPCMKLLRRSARLTE